MTNANDPWLALRNAIVEQAAIDYKLGFCDPEGYSMTGNSKKMKHATLRDDAATFFKSKWCNALLGMDDSDATGEAILRRLKEYTLADLKEGQENCSMKVTLLQQTPNPIDTIVKIGSICYDSKPTNKQAMVRHLFLNGHHSVFEHVYFTFKIEGISRACSHQLVRHRLAAFTQRSQRYCGENAFDYVMPEQIEMNRELSTKYEHMMQDISNLYTDMVHTGDIKREDARFLLPNACETELVMSCNLRELIHIANERLCSRAQWEIRQVVKQMVKLVDPDLQWMLTPKCESGFMICNQPCRGKGYVIRSKPVKEAEEE